MSDTRAALLVGCSKYGPDFRQLPALARDIDALKCVLKDPTIGDFTVAPPLRNEQSGTVKQQIEKFFADRKPDDLLLLYFSCHGIQDGRGRLHLVAADTKKQRLGSTGIAARWVKEQMDHSRSQRIVLLLDCCYGGAFTRGPMHRSADPEEIIEQLGGRGRVVITASDTMELAYGSEFTNAVVHGLQTGAADLDGDGRVSVNELYRYVYDQVQRNAPDQTPTMSADGVRGELYLAKNPHALMPLPAELEGVLASESAWKRLWAVDGLQRLLASDHPEGQKRTARQALVRLRDDGTDPDVRAAASEALPAVSPRPDITDRRRPHYHRLVGAGLALAVVLALIIASILIPRPPPTSEACSPITKPADGTLSFGTLFPKTGDFDYTGPAFDAGVQLAMKDIKDAGGIPGIQVKLDDTSQRDEGNPSADTASQSVDALLSGNVDVIIGPATSAVALKVIDKVTCAGVIMFSPANTSPVFTTYPSHGLYFRTAPPDTLEGPVLGKLVVDDGNSTAVVMSRDDVYGNYMREATAKAIQKFGGRVLDSFSYDPNTRDYDKEVQRIKAKNPDAIVLISFNEDASILTKMIKEGLGPRNKRVYDPNMASVLAGEVNPRNPGVLAGMKGTSRYAGDEAFVKRLREISPEPLQDPTYAAQAYDAVIITALAAAVAGTDAPAVVAKDINGVTRAGEKCTSFAACMALVKDHKDIAYVGASGPLEFTDHGEPSTDTYVISEIQPDGTVKPLKIVRANSPEYPPSGIHQ
ncbi:MAG: ABC transporter substrate-binding protein [Pseudonocardiales bacterium]|nr:ABC transporter substrate-binding protein [Pseudonocardiales bacterium]